ncbi:Zinc/iron permease [Marasmius fiardii PR-910]|nr:Zinc/iron permease [Marasmius fiardii PR-910]
MGIIFAISLFAVSFPAISQGTKFLPIPKIVFFIGKHFGTGVILSTAFVHLLKDSFEALSDPLVKSRYPGVTNQVGLIILGSLLLIFLVEYLSTSVVDHLHRHDDQEDDDAPTITGSPQTEPQAQDLNEVTPLLQSSLSRHDRGPSSTLAKHSLNHVHDVVRRPTSHYLTSIVTNSPRHCRSSEFFYILNDVNHHINNGEYHVVGGKKGGGCVCVCVCPASQGGSLRSSRHIEGFPSTSYEEEETRREEEDHDHNPPELSRKRQIVGILVLQMGIMIHSLVIGLTLAIASGSEFTTLTTAIIFHQLFEGLSLGIRIAAIPPPHSPSPSSLPLHNPKPDDDPNSRKRRIGWLRPLLSFLFAVTTPVGICLGILLFSVDKHSEEAKMLLTQGLMSAISAGMLIYAGTVEMLAGDFVFAIGSGGGHGHSHGEEFMHEEGGEDSHGRPSGEEGSSTWGRKVVALLSLCAGVVGMSLIGLGE